VEAILIIDDFVGTGTQICDNLTTFVGENVGDAQRGIPIILVTIAATKDGFEFVHEHIEEQFGERVKFRVCEVLDDRYTAFGNDATLWESESERNKAKSICLNLGVDIYRDNPLGFGNQGLLLVFPTTVPNNTIPILHSSGSRDKRWRPLFPRLVN
jgi:hypothetical protein